MESDSLSPYVAEWLRKQLGIPEPNYRRGAPMAHHSDEFREQGDRIAEMMNGLRGVDDAVRGEFPNGKLNGDDEGALAIATTTQNGTVVMGFPKPIDWLGFPPDLAREFAQQLLDSAKECDGIECQVRRIIGD